MTLTPLKMLMRDWRGGELGVLIAALVVAVATVAGIAAFAARLQSALEQESHRFLAADRVVQSSRALPEGWEQLARGMALSWAETLSFPSMVYADDDSMSLASVKAVSDDYPLRGDLTVSDQPFGEPRIAASGPRPGEVWLDSRLFPLLDVAIGDTIGIGEGSFLVTAAARNEPDRASGVYGYGPRVMMHMEDIPATDVIRPGSRVQYRQLFAGDEATLLELENRLRPQLREDQRWRDLNQAQPGVGRALARAEQFLLLAGSLAVVLAGVAIALAARRFSDRHNDYVAIFKSLGATSGHINRLYALNLLVIGLLAAGLGCLLGWALQALFFNVFAEALPITPGESGATPYLLGAGTALVTLLGFAWPPLGRLAGTSPLRILRRDLPLVGTRTLSDFGYGLLAISGLMWWYSQNLVLSLSILAGVGINVLIGTTMALLLLRGSRLAGMRAGSIWRLALAGLQRRGVGNAIQVMIFATAITMLLVLVLVRTTLIEDWRQQLPVDAPNHFLINIAPDQVAGVEQLLGSEDIASEPLFPMVRGRLMAINEEQLVSSDDPARGRRQVESNLTWSDHVPAGNTLQQGSWWRADSAEGQVSVEQGFAERLGIGMGDRLEFRVGSRSLVATVSSIRALEWQSMQPNFYLVFPRELLSQYPAMFITSFHLRPENKLFLNRLIRQYPTATVIEMDIVVEQIRQVVGQVSAAIELVLVIILAAGGLVLIAGVQSSVDDRMREGAILRALGGKQRLLLGGLMIEFSVLGLLAGGLAVLGAEGSTWLLKTRVLDMDYAPSMWIWPVGLVLGTLVIAVLGVLSCRSVVSTSPLTVLREL